MSRPDSTRFSTRSRVARETLIVDLGLACASCPLLHEEGELRTTRYILNHQVPSNPMSNGAVGTWDNPSPLPETSRRVARD